MEGPALRAGDELLTDGGNWAGALWVGSENETFAVETSEVSFSVFSKGAPFGHDRGSRSPRRQ